MVLLEKGVENEGILEMIREKLSMCIENESVVCIHGHINGMVIRNAAVIEQFELDHDGISLTSGWFEFHVETTIKEFLYNEEENSIYVVLDNGIIYLDMSQE